MKGLLEIHETEEEHAASPCPGRRDMSDESSFEASDSDSPVKDNENQENAPMVNGIDGLDCRRRGKEELDNRGLASVIFG